MIHVYSRHELQCMDFLAWTFCALITIFGFISLTNADLSCAMQYNILPNSYFALNDTLNNFVTMYQVEAGGVAYYTSGSTNASPIRLLNFNVRLNRIFTNNTISRIGTDSSASKLILLAQFYNIGRWNKTLAVPMNGDAVRADWNFFNNITIELRTPQNDLAIDLRGLPLGSTIGRLLQVGTGAGTYPTDYGNTSAGWDFIWRTFDPRIDQSPDPWTWGGFLRFNLEIACPCDREFPFTNFLGNPGIPPDYSLHLRPRYSREPTKTFYYTVACAYSQLPIIYGFDYNYYLDPTEKIIRIRAFLQPLETLSESNRNLLLLDMIFQGVPQNKPLTGYGAPVDANNLFTVYPYNVDDAVGNDPFATSNTLKRLTQHFLENSPLAKSVVAAVPMLRHILHPIKTVINIPEVEIQEVLQKHRATLSFSPATNLLADLDLEADHADKQEDLSMSLEEEKRLLDVVSSGLQNLFLSSLNHDVSTSRAYRTTGQAPVHLKGKDAPKVPFLIDSSVKRKAALAGKTRRQYPKAADVSDPYIQPFTPVYSPPPPPGRLYNDLPTLGSPPTFGNDIQYFKFIKGTLDDLVNNAQYDIVPLNSTLFPSPTSAPNQLGPYLQVGTNANTLAEGYGAWFPFQFRLRRGRLWRLGNFTVIINNPSCPVK
jgi:hypothetical protein